MSEYSREQLERSAAKFGLPAHLRPGLVGHVVDGRPVGGFLTACLQNDLIEAVCRAGDDLTLADLRAVAKWIYNEAPGGCWGSPDKVAAWQSTVGA